MTRRVRFESAADLETTEAAAWYEQRRTGLGDQFLESIERALDLAMRQRVPGSLVAGVEDLKDVRSVPVTRFPYQLVLIASPDELLVIAVMHERRLPRYWIRRIAD